MPKNATDTTQHYNRCRGCRGEPTMRWLPSQAGASLTGGSTRGYPVCDACRKLWESHGRVAWSIATLDGHRRLV